MDPPPPPPFPSSSTHIHIVAACSITWFGPKLNTCKLSTRTTRLGRLTVCLFGGGLILLFLVKIATHCHNHRCAVVLEKGEIPPREPGQIYVSNHSTVIDVVVLMKGQLYSLTGQAHEGTIGFFQKYILFPMVRQYFIIIGPFPTFFAAPPPPPPPHAPCDICHLVPTLIGC